MNFIFLCCLQITVTACGKGIKVKDVAALATNVIGMSIKFGNEMSSGNDNEKLQESIEQLQSSVQKLHDKLDYTTQLVEHLIDLINEQTYKISLSQHVEKIKSCKTDLENILHSPTSSAAQENFQKCTNIIDNVRAIGDYLSGHNIIGLQPFFELFRHKDGYYSGLAIKTMFQYLYSYFADGCTVVVTAERIFSNQSTLIKDGCLKTIENVNSYMEEFFRKCITQSCSWFHSQTTDLLDEPEIKDASSAYNALQDNFPWFQFLVIKHTGSDPVVLNDGTFPLISKTYRMQKTYQVFLANSFQTFAEHNTTENELLVNVTIKICEYEGSSNGINLTKQVYLEEKLFSFVGFTSNYTLDACDYQQEFDRSSLASLPRKLPISELLVFIACVSHLFI